LAYATQEDEKFYVSDYDAININFPITEPSNQLHLMDAHVPCFASGSPKQFENLCKAFVELSNQRIDILKQQADHYHDQEFFLYNSEELKNHHNIVMTRDRNKLLSPYIKDCLTPIIHFSHFRCKTNSNRIKLIKEILS